MQGQTLEAPTEEQLEQWWSEFSESETSLTIHQLFLLMGIEAGSEDCGVHEPIWPLISRDPLPPITEAPGLQESQLLMMAQARALERLGFISLSHSDQYGWHWTLTPKGKAAVAYWSEALQERLPGAPDEASPT